MENIKIELQARIKIILFTIMMNWYIWSVNHRRYNLAERISINIKIVKLKSAISTLRIKLGIRSINN